MQITAMKKDDFYRQMFKLTIPIIIQNLLSAAVNSADVIMWDSPQYPQYPWRQIFRMSCLWYITDWGREPLSCAPNIMERGTWKQFIL